MRVSRISRRSASTSESECVPRRASATQRPSIIRQPGARHKVDSGSAPEQAPRYMKPGPNAISSLSPSAMITPAW